MTKERILVVEDDLNLLEGVRTVLELDGYAVLTAQNGQQALQVLRAQGAPHLIVSDIMMPVMDGLQLLHEVRKEPTWLSIPFIFLTARSEKSDIRRGKLLGVDDYLVKPFDADDLLIAIEARLQRHRTLIEAHHDEMSDLKRKILTILNHEFRTPLTFIVAYSDMLNGYESLLSDQDILTFLRGVNVGAVRLRRLVENFIQLVEMETGDAQRMYEMRRALIHDIRLLIDNAQASVFLPEVTHTCTVWVDEDIPPFMGDAHYLTLALVQLLENAIKFSPADQPIVVGAKVENNEVLLWVSDGGRGIEPAEQERIWESFYQVNRPVFEDQGAGSGLAIVRGIAKLHGGRVHVDGQPGVGSTFTLALPLVTEMATRE